MNVLKKMLIYPIFIFIAISIYMTFIEGKLFIIKKNEIMIDDRGGNTLRVIQFTDTQLGDYYTIEQLKKVVDDINRMDPDIVVFTGDLIDNAAQYEQKEEVAQVLGGIKANKGKYAIYGNHDYGGGGVRFYEDIMTYAGFEVLVNEGISVDLGDRQLSIYGADEMFLGEFSEEATMEGIKEKDINLLLLHEPDLIDEFKNYPIDLALAGHSHGGQIYIPFYGPLVKNSLSEKYNKGMYNLDNNRGTSFYVNSGLGNTKAPFRFFNIPQITIFEVKY